jgi:heme a synthase
VSQHHPVNQRHPANQDHPADRDGRTGRRPDGDGSPEAAVRDAPPPDRGPAHRIRAVLEGPALLRRTALASVIANVGIVVTGGVVRLTGSGMGCPTWPRCDRDSLVPTRELGYHGMIEFGNRTLISVVGGLAVAGAVLALLQRPRRGTRLTWAGLVLTGIAAQAVLGGATVHTVLNPWIVSAHFLLSIAVIAVAYRFWVATREADGPGRPLLSRPLRGLSWLVVGVSAAVLTAGTVVTGSGPHAGDVNARRTGLDPGMVAQLHADLVMLLIGLSIGLWYALRTAAGPRPTIRAAAVLVGVELAQGLIGFVQYFTHVPALLVGLHMAGACAVWLATLTVLARSRVHEEPAPVSPAAAGPALRVGTPEPANARSAPVT